MAHGSEVEKLERRWMENPMGVSFAPLAEAYRRAGDHPRALEVLAVGLANHPAYVPALIVQARCHLDVRADGAAEESFLAVLASDGHNLIALKGLADICERSDRPAQARKHLDRLLEADPTHDDARAQMDRVTAVLAERERLLEQAAPAASTATEEVLEPMGFEPTDTSSFDDPSALDALALSVEPIIDAGDAPAPEAHPEGEMPAPTEPGLIQPEAVAAGEVETVAGLESIEADLELEREIAPFDSELDDAPVVIPGLGMDGPGVPFEEELPASWLEGAGDAPSADLFRDELSVEAIAEEVPPVPDEPVTGELSTEEPFTAPDLDAPVWAPMGSTWTTELPNEPIEEASSPAEPERGPEELRAADAAPEASTWESVPTGESLEPIAAEIPEAVELAPEVAPWALPAPEPEPIEPADSSEAHAAETETRLSEVEPPAEATGPVGDWAAFAEPRDEAPPVEVPTPSVAAVEPSETAGWQSPSFDSLPASEDADDDVVVVDGAESELPADAEPEIEPALIMTETMARLFERQGHRTMALAIYAQLAEQDPGNPELSAAIERLTGELSSAPAGSGGGGAGAAEAAAVGAILGRGPVRPVSGASAPAEQAESGLRLDAPATRASEDLFSLSAVFGPTHARPSAQHAGFSPGADATDREPSFDEFFGNEEAAGSAAGQAGRAGGEEDLEQFTAWLRSLKR